MEEKEKKHESESTDDTDDTNHDTVDDIVVGSWVEVRANNVDELFYLARVTKVEADGLFHVIYEDGTSGEGLKRSSILFPANQRLIKENDSIRVVDGHMWLNHQVVDARLLSFSSSPHLFQSAVVLQSKASVVFNYAIMPFDVCQALILSLPLHWSLSSEANNTQESKETKAFKACILGAGAGSIAMGLLAHAQLQQEGEETCSVDLVELSPSVLEIAHECFGVPREDARLNLHVEDGVRFTETKRDEREQYDLFFIDVAAGPNVSGSDEVAVEDEDQVILPPDEFLEVSFLHEKVRMCVTEKGWVLLNILAGGKTLLKVIRGLEEVYGSVYVLATDPNYVLYFSRTRRAITPQDVYEAGVKFGFEESCGPVMRDVRDSERYHSKGILLGWFTSTQFCELIETGRVLI